MAVRNNVTRMLDARKVAYTPVEYDPSRFHSAGEVAALLGVPAAQVFKTIVVLREGRGHRPLLVILPAEQEVNLKGLAAALGEKKLHVAAHREAEALTKLQVGGISALALIGKGFETLLDRAAETYAEDGIYVSGGQRGLNLRIRPADLLAITGGRWTGAPQERSQTAEHS